MNRFEREQRRRRSGFLPDLVFAWRVRRRGDVGRFLVAFLIASAGFAGAALVFRVQGGIRVSASSGRETARVEIIRPDDVASRRLLEWAKEASPFPDRWAPESSEAVSLKMEEVEMDLRAASRYVPKLRPGRNEPDHAAEPGLLALRGSQFPKPVGRWSDDPRPATPSRVRAVARPEAGLSQRWRPLQEGWEGLEFYKLLGKEARFVLGVDEQGTVVFCLASEGLDPLLDRELRNWLRGHALKPSEEPGVQWGTVIIKVQALEPEAGEARESGEEGRG